MEIKDAILTALAGGVNKTAFAAVNEEALS
jgi:hypothetical protein